MTQMERATEVAYRHEYKHIRSITHLSTNEFLVCGLYGSKLEQTYHTIILHDSVDDFFGYGHYFAEDFTAMFTEYNKAILRKMRVEGDK